MMLIFVVHFSLTYFLDFRDSTAEKSFVSKLFSSGFFALVFVPFMRYTDNSGGREDTMDDPAYFAADQFDILKAHLEKYGYEPSKEEGDKVIFKLKKLSLKNLSDDVYIISNKHYTSINAPSNILKAIPSGLEKLRYVQAV